MLCFKERSPQKKKYSNAMVTEENIAVVYYSLRSMIVATRKVHFSYVLLLPSSWWWRRCGWELAVDSRLTDRSLQTGVGQVGASDPLTRLFWKLPLTLPKSRDLFSYIEILENKSKIPECLMSPVKLSWNTW